MHRCGKDEDGFDSHVHFYLLAPDGVKVHCSAMGLEVCVKRHSFALIFEKGTVSLSLACIVRVVQFDLQ